MGSARDIFDAGISDHAPVRVAVSCKAVLPRDERPIATEVLRHPRFAAVHDELAAYAKLEGMKPFTRLEAHKAVIKEAAMRVRDEISVMDGQAAGGDEQAAKSIARALWQGDVRAGRLLARSSDFVRRHICFFYSSMQLRDPAGFASEVDALRAGARASRQLSLQKAKGRSEKARSKVSWKLDRLARFSLLWVGHGKKTRA